MRRPGWPVDRRRNRLLWVAVAALGVGMIGAPHLQHAGRTVETYPSAGIAKVEVVTGGTDVEIRAGAAGGASMQGAYDVSTRSFAGLTCRPQQSVKDDVMRIDLSCPDRPFGPDARAVLSMPQDSTVLVDAGSGDVDLAGDFASAQVATSSGSVDFDDVRAALRVQTTSGEIEGRVEAASSLSIESTSGKTTLDLGADVRGVQVVTTSAAVRLELAKDQYRWDAKTDSGDTDIEVDGGSAPAYTGTVRSESGSIKIERD